VSDPLPTYAVNVTTFTGGETPSTSTKICRGPEQAMHETDRQVMRILRAERGSCEVWPIDADPEDAGDMGGFEIKATRNDNTTNSFFVRTTKATASTSCPS
jgi:hypothetical protein